MSTEEEDNYIRIALLLTGISPRAVRYYFDQEYHPSFLERTMRQGRNVLTDLKTKRVINTAQWDLLFPRTGNPESKKFDVTLMITLLRNLASVPVPNDLPVPTDTSKGAALGTIKYYRNYLAHLHDSSVDTCQFNIIWTALEKAIQTLGGTSMYDEATKLRTKVLDKSNIEIMLSIKQSLKEIQDLRQIVTDLTTEHESLKTQHQVLQQEHKALEKKFMDPVPPNIREMTKSKLKRWKDEDTMFAVTLSSKEILKRCIKNPYVTITGNSGMGKTATLRHVALQMAECGYDIIPVHNPDDIKQYDNPNKKTLFVVDDFCGKYSADKNEICRWGQLTENSLRYLDNTVVKIIVSCRLQVFQDELFGTLSLFKTCVCNLLSNDFKLSTNDIKSIAKIYSKGNADKIVQYAHLHDCFPLLCKLYRDNPSLDLDFFQHPFTVYETELNQMQTHNYVSYCALALCVMFNNNVEEELFTEEICHDLRSVFENTFEACKLNRGTSRLKIRDSLDSLINTYITKRRNIYKTIHDKMFDYLSYYFGQKMITCLLGYASIKWISERLIIDINDWGERLIIGKYILGIETEFVVIVNPKYSLLLMKRLVKEWSNGQIDHVFLSINMIDSEFRKRFLCVIQSLDQTEQNNLAQKTDLLNKSNPLIHSAFYNDTQWIRWCLDHGISVKMTDKYGSSPLHMACYLCKENTNVIQILLDNKAKVNQCTTDIGHTPLHTACEKGYKELIQMLLDHKANINQGTTDYGITPLWIACEKGYTEIVQLLLANKANINQSTTSNGTTPLYVTCQQGHTKIVQILLKNKAHINQCTTDTGVTPLHIACQNGHTEIVKILIDNKADLNQCTTDTGETALYIACQNGHTEIVQLLLDNKANINQRTTFNRLTPLYIACQEGNIEIVKILLNCKAHINQCATDIGITPLNKACAKGHAEIVQLLLEDKANINQCTTDNGTTPLYIACKKGNTEIVKILLKNKAEINQCTTDIGLSPLHIACKQGHAEIVQILIVNKAEINQCTTDIGLSPLHIACQEGHSEVVQKLIFHKADIYQCTTDNGVTPLYIACQQGYTEIVKNLLKNKADMNQSTTNSCSSPLYIACQKGNTEVVQELIDNKADINQCCTPIGTTPLHIACQFGHTEIVQKLIDNNADINQCAIYHGLTPLHMACMSGYAKTVQILLDNKADIRLCTTDNGLSPLYLACGQSHTEIVKMLLENMADINQCTVHHETPFFIACQEGYTNIVKILLGNKADINVCSKRNGRSPLCAACHYGHIEVVKIILDNSGIIKPCLCSKFKRFHSKSS